MTRANSWTAEEEAWLREVYPHHSNADISTMHASVFPDRPDRSDKAVNSRAKVLKLRKADGFVRNPPTFWTPGKVEWFRSFVPGHSESEISAEHERIYGEPLSEGQISNSKVRFGVKSGTHGGRFKKGDGGFASEEHRRKFMEAGKATRFRKGNMPSNALDKPIGTERVDAKDGYVYVKVAERKTDPRSAHDNWKPKHHLVYEQAHGSIPSGCNVIFADHDKRNFDPENLVAVPRSLWSVISRQGYLYSDRESLETCMALAELNSKVYRAQCRPRECRKCGRPFKSRYPNQRTCDTCLGR